MISIWKTTTKKSDQFIQNCAQLMWWTVMILANARHYWMRIRGYLEVGIRKADWYAVYLNIPCTTPGPPCNPPPQPPPTPVEPGLYIYIYIYTPKVSTKGFVMYCMYSFIWTSLYPMFWKCMKIRVHLLVYIQLSWCSVINQLTIYYSFITLFTCSVYHLHTQTHT